MNYIVSKLVGRLFNVDLITDYQRYQQGKNTFEQHMLSKFQKNINMFTI